MSVCCVGRLLLIIQLLIQFIPQVFAWDASEKGAEVHLQANPTQLALMRTQFEERKAALAAQVCSYCVAFAQRTRLTVPPPHGTSRLHLGLCTLVFKPMA